MNGTRPFHKFALSFRPPLPFGISLHTPRVVVDVDVASVAVVVALQIKFQQTTGTGLCPILYLILLILLRFSLSATLFRCSRFLRFSYFLTSFFFNGFIPSFFSLFFFGGGGGDFVLAGSLVSTVRYR